MRGTHVAFTLFDSGAGFDLLAVAPDALRLWHHSGGRFADVTATAALDRTIPGTGIAAVFGDYDNDGKADVFLLRGGGNRLLHQGAGGAFADVTAAAGIGRQPDRRRRLRRRRAAFVDVDHDGDLDIAVGGWGAPNQLLRNNGNGTFTETAAAAGLRGGAARALAIVPTDFDNRRDVDLLIADQDGPPALFRNMRDGSFADAAAQVGLQAVGAPRRSPPETSTRTATPISSSAAPASPACSRSATDAARSWRRTRRRTRPMRSPRRSSTTTTTACSICSWPARAGRIFSGTPAAAGST